MILLFTYIVVSQWSIELINKILFADSGTYTTIDNVRKGVK